MTPSFLCNSRTKLCNQISTHYNSNNSTFLSTWHARLGRASSKVVSLVLNKCKIPFTINKLSFVCKFCCIAKSYKLSFYYFLRTYKQPPQLVHSNRWGLAPIPSTNGSRYYIHFIDAYSKFTWIYLLHTKSQAIFFFIHFKSMIENQLGTTIKAFQFDRGKKYNPFTKYLNSFGIIHCFSCLYTHEQNG